MSDTPETDATANPLWGDAQELCLLRELARKLERERDEAVKRVRDCGQHMIQVCEELDAGAGVIALDAAVMVMGRLRRAERERDEAVLQLGAMQAAIAEVLNLPRTPTTADEIRGAAQHLTTPAQ